MTVNINADDATTGNVSTAMSRWENVIPWFLTIASTVTLACIAWFLVENIMWFRSNAMNGDDMTHTTYRLHIYHLHIAMIKRSVGLFSGFALLFLGTGVVFYTLRTQSTVNFAIEKASAGIVSASPGIIAMALGVLLLLGTIASKDDFPPYTGESESSTPTRLNVVPFSGETTR
jgi:p-aminobenzoyl-glutamate transporter AbgT